MKQRRKRFGIVGFGGAGYSAALAIRQELPDAKIDVFTDTEEGPYNPMLTTYYVKDAIPYKACFPFGGKEEIKHALNLNLFEDTPVTGLIARQRKLVLADGKKHIYDKILIATGASAFVPRMPGAELPGIYKMRTLEDAKKLKEDIDDGRIKTGLVIGASWVGIKVVEDFLHAGIETTLVDGAPYMFAVAAFPEAAARVQKDLEKRGVKLSFGQMLSHIEQEEGGRLTAVMQSGDRFSADTVAVCIGVRPNTGFLRESGIEIGRGITVNDRMQTNFPDIYAAGDCCEAIETQSGAHKNIGVWMNALKQGEAAGKNMAGGDAKFGANILVNLAHYADYDFVSMGDVASVRPEDEVYEYEDKKYYIRAARDAHRVKCINMIGTAGLNGVVKSLFIKAISEEKPQIDRMTAGMLIGNGIPGEFIRFIIPN